MAQCVAGSQNDCGAWNPHIPSRTELDEFHEKYGFKICPSLDEDKRIQVLRLLYKYRSVFARDVTEIKACKGPPLKLDVHTNRKTFQRQYRLSDTDKTEVTRQINQMLDADVIEPSDTPYYNSPICLVAKKSGEKRLVVDLRAINKIITPKLVQLPKIEEMLDTITASKPKWLTGLDITAAFWQTTVDEGSRDLLTFTGPDGRRWRFKRSPFGLHSSPSHLILILSNLFSDKTRFHNIAVYMDDICCFSNDWDSHIEQLELTLRTLQDARLSCNPKKTEIAYPEMEYLGYRISGDSIRISNKRIEVIKKITPPKNVKALQRLLGMMNYWKKHVPHFSKNTYNMRQLLRKDAPFDWTVECDKELEYLKTCLTSDPVLKPIDPDKDIVLTTDGSIYGLGWSVLQEGDDGLLHAVSYGSFATTPHQANYSADDLEAISVMYGLKSIECFALCRHVTVITDNSHVLHMNTWKPINARQRRMIAYIMQFDISFVFIKGSRNCLADALSRMYQDSSQQERVDNTARYMYEAEDFILPVTTRSVSKQTDQFLNVQGVAENSDTSAENSPQEIVDEETDQTDQVIIETNNQVTENEVNDQVTEKLTTSANEVIPDNSNEEVMAETLTFPVIS